MNFDRIFLTYCWFNGVFTQSPIKSLIFLCNSVQEKPNFICKPYVLKAHRIKARERVSYHFSTMKILSTKHCTENQSVFILCKWATLTHILVYWNVNLSQWNLIKMLDTFTTSIICLCIHGSLKWMVIFEFDIWKYAKVCRHWNLSSMCIITHFLFRIQQSTCDNPSEWTKYHNPTRKQSEAADDWIITLDELSTAPYFDILRTDSFYELLFYDTKENGHYSCAGHRSCHFYFYTMIQRYAIWRYHAGVEVRAWRSCHYTLYITYNARLSSAVLKSGGSALSLISNKI